MSDYVVWKCKLTLDSKIEIPVLHGEFDQFIHVETYDEGLELYEVWFTVKPTLNEHSTGILYVFGTGTPIPEYLKDRHFQTIKNGPYFWHFFDGGIK